ncbi:MAG TPA: HEAT repeat domain-containing protein [Candidatus Acidoferrales bacterium]|nr:HEAT repeat domain-containing protein [Candidatus Acidoferrales bacterium]
MSSFPVDAAEILQRLGSGDSRIQRAAAEECARRASTDPTIRPKLVAALGSADAPLRWGAAYALSRLGPAFDEADDAFVEYLGSEVSDVRWTATEILSDPIVLRRVAERMRNLIANGTPVQRRMALYCLRNECVNSAQFDASIDRALDDQDHNVRLAAMSCLARITRRKPEAAERLSERLFDENAAVRRAAAAHLGKLEVATSQILSSLESLRDHPDVSLRRAVHQALTRLRDRTSRSR